MATGTSFGVAWRATRFDSPRALEYTLPSKVPAQPMERALARVGSVVDGKWPRCASGCRRDVERLRGDAPQRDTRRHQDSPSGDLATSWPGPGGPALRASPATRAGGTPCGVSAAVHPLRRSCAARTGSAGRQPRRVALPCRGPNHEHADSLLLGFCLRPGFWRAQAVHDVEGMGALLPPVRYISARTPTPSSRGVRRARRRPVAGG
jgi:hypothetical protein